MPAETLTILPPDDFDCLLLYLIFEEDFFVADFFVEKFNLI